METRSCGRERMGKDRVGEGKVVVGITLECEVSCEEGNLGLCLL